ncbi:MAG: quinone-dependent dihydroorotate dehydrogenase [Hyphomicrobiaceae bacterium]|nr:quinone-dependent dihydroorotate dehydrogenase [Hyphomicrobiaceae bacterium]
MILSRLSPFLRNSFLLNLTRDALLAMEPETAHRATIMALKIGLVPQLASEDAPELETCLAGLQLSNPVGMAAGFDKNAEVFSALEAMGVGFAEVGTVTPEPQDGNPRPRLFRLMQSEGVINRMGFNNEGHEAAYQRLTEGERRAPTGVNIGANKTSDDFVADYVAGVRRFADVADYLTVNISSPNTPGLRGLQNRDVLERLLGEVLTERERQPKRVPVFLKIAPDLDEAAMDGIAAAIAPTPLNGLIVSNTTIDHSFVEGQPYWSEQGGLSGKPLFRLATQRLAQMRQRVGPHVSIIGVGGVHSPQSALAKFQAGANAIQLYSALVFGGLELLEEIKLGLARRVRQAGRTNISEFVGERTDAWAAGRGILPD